MADKIKPYLILLEILLRQIEDSKKAGNESDVKYRVELAKQYIDVLSQQ